MIDGFTTELTAKLTNVPTTLLENWRRARFLVPSVPAPRRGVSATYSFRDLVALRVVCELRDAGISLQALGKVVKYLRARKGLSTTEVLASTTLVTDGHDVFEVDGQMTVSALRKQGQRILFFVPLDGLVTELQARTRALRAA